MMVRPCWGVCGPFKMDRDKQRGPEGEIKMVRAGHDQKEDMGMSNWGRRLQGQMIFQTLRASSWNRSHTDSVNPESKDQ